jgi:hypothetical protein
MEHLISYVDEETQTMHVFCILCGATATSPILARPDGMVEADIDIKHTLDCLYGAAQAKKLN